VLPLVVERILDICDVQDREKIPIRYRDFVLPKTESLDYDYVKVVLMLL
jgi:hypothetical protein